MRVIQATGLALSIDADGPLFGIALIGPSGSGKTSVALAAVESCPWRRTRLVGDDAIAVRNLGIDLMMASHETTGGLAEIRNTALIGITPAAPTLLSVVLDLGGEAQRLPPDMVFRPLGEGGPALPRYVWGRSRSTDGLISLCRAAAIRHSRVPGASRPRHQSETL